MPSAPTWRAPWRRRALIAFAAVAVSTAFVFWNAHTGVSADTLRREIQALGPWSQVAFVVAFGVIQPLGPPGHGFVLSAALLWPPAEAFGCSLAGALLAQALSIAVYRSTLRDWATRRIPERALRYEAVLLRRPGLGVLVVRLCTFTGQLAAMALAISRVPVWSLCWGTVLGLIPGIAVDVWLGEELRAWWSSR